MTPELARMVAIFSIAWKPRPEAGPAPGIPVVPNGIRGSDLAISLALGRTPAVGCS
jgi:hypothetical protein